MALNYVKLELTTGGVSSTGRVFKLSCSDYENFEHRFLKRSGNICLNKESEDPIENTNDFEELEFVFFDSDDRELKIIKNQKREREKMRLRLVDVETSPYEEEVGTCELCTSVKMVNEPVFVFEKNNRELIRVRAFVQGWGFYDEENIENIADSAAYVSEQRFDEEQELDYSWLTSLIYEYRHRKN